MKILIVDDSKFIRIVLTKIITDNFPETTLYTACNGEEGFEKYKSNKPDIILVDLLMPIMSGTQMIEAIRKTDTTVKIIVISADIQTTVRDEISQLQVLEFFNKPIDQGKTIQLINLIKECQNA